MYSLRKIERSEMPHGVSIERSEMNPDIFTKLSYGLYIVSSKKDDKFNGQIADCVMQVTANPPIIAVSINQKNLTNEYIKASRNFTVSILAQTATLKFIGHFGFKSGRELDKFKEINYKLSANGVPIVLDNTIGYLECEVLNFIDIETHTIFLGKAVSAELFSDDEPMTYDYYHKMLKGKTAKNAPTYIEEIKVVKEGR